MFSCFICGVSRSSKFALKRHQRKEHPSAGTTATRRVEGTVAAVIATSSQPSTSDTRSVVTAHQSESMRGRHDLRRPAVDRIVRELQSRYRQNPAYLRKSSAEIASDLRRGTRGHKLTRVVYLAVAVTAKAFAGGKHRPVPCASRRVRVQDPPAKPREIPWEPAQQCFQERQPVTTPTGIVQGARRRGRRGDRTLDPVRRVLFHSATSGSTEAVPPEGRQKIQSVIGDCPYFKVTRPKRLNHRRRWVFAGLRLPYFPAPRSRPSRCHPKTATPRGVRTRQRSSWRRIPYQRCQAGHSSRKTENYFAMTARAGRPGS